MDAKELDYNLSTVRDLFEPLLEAGVFTEDESAAEEIACLLGAAALLSQQGETSVAMTTVLVAEALINGKVRRKGLLWRIWNLHMFPLWLYHVACCALTFFLALRVSSYDVLGIPVAGLLVGAFGAELRGLYWLQWQVSARKFRPTSVVAHLTAPLIGALLGMLAYLVGDLGILVLAHPSTMTGGHSLSGSPESGNLAPLVLAFLSGFKWEWVLEHLEQTVFSKADSKG